MTPCENNCEVKYNLVTELSWQKVSTTTLIWATEYRWYLPGGILKTDKEYNKDIRHVFGGIQGQMDVGNDGLPVTTIAVTGKARMPVAYPTDVTIFPPEFTWVGRIQTEDMDHQVSLCFQQSDWATATITNNIKYTTQPAVTAAATHYRLVPRYRQSLLSRTASRPRSRTTRPSRPATSPHPRSPELRGRAARADRVRHRHRQRGAAGGGLGGPAARRRRADPDHHAGAADEAAARTAAAAAAEHGVDVHRAPVARAQASAQTDEHAGGRGPLAPQLANGTAVASGRLAGPRSGARRRARGSSARPLPQRPGRKQSEVQMDPVVTAPPVEPRPATPSGRAGPMSSRACSARRRWTRRSRPSRRRPSRCR